MKLNRTRLERRDAQIVAAYLSGDREEQVAAQFGLTVATVERVLQDRHVGVRGGHNYRVYRRTYDEGVSVRALAARAGVSYGTMRNGLTDVGTRFRPRGPRPGLPQAGAHRITVICPTASACRRLSGVGRATELHDDTAPSHTTHGRQPRRTSPTRPETPETSVLTPQNLAETTLELTDYLMSITLELIETGAAIESREFGLSWTQASFAILHFADALQQLVPTPVATDGTQPAILAPAEHGTWLLHRQQTLELLRFIDLARSHAAAFTVAGTARDKEAALYALARLALHSGVRFNLTARLLAAQRAHRVGQTLADIADGLGVSQADIEQMLTDADSLLANPHRPTHQPPTTTGRRPQHQKP